MPVAGFYFLFMSFTHQFNFCYLSDDLSIYIWTKPVVPTDLCLLHMFLWTRVESLNVPALEHLALNEQVTNLNPDAVYTDQLFLFQLCRSVVPKLYPYLPASDWLTTPDPAEYREGIAGQQAGQWGRVWKTSKVDDRCHTYEKIPFTVQVPTITLHLMYSPHPRLALYTSAH